MKVQWLVDNRGDMPGTAGLEEAIALPDDGLIVRGFECLYDWKIGTPVPADLADCFSATGAITVNLREWIGSWVPAGFRGHVVLDSEKWELQRSLVDQAQLDKVKAKFPGRSWTDLYTRLVWGMAVQLRLMRPGCTAGWYAGVSWHPDQFDRLTPDIREAMAIDVIPPLSRMDVLHPVIYASQRPNEFSPAYEQIRLAVDLPMHKPIVPIMSCTRVGDGQFVDRSEVLAALAAAGHFKCTSVMAWCAIQSPAHAALLQDWTTNVLHPAIEEHNHYTQ